LKKSQLCEEPKFLNQLCYLGAPIYLMVGRMFRRYLCPHQTLFSTVRDKELLALFTMKVG